MKKIVGLLIIPLVVLVFASVSGSSEKGPFELITAEEAAAPDLDPSALHVEVGMSDEGPVIEVLSPHMGASIKGPVLIDVRFIKKDDMDIDPSTVKVEYLKFLTIDLTPRVRDYVSKEGIKVPNANLPAGTHTIRLSVGDTTGTVTKQVFTFEVI